MTSITRVALALILGLLTVADASAESVRSLRFIGAVTVPNELRVDGTLVGGLSGIDYDRKTRQWILISDDSSRRGPARLYVAKLNYDAKAFNSVEITKAVTLRRRDGSPYPAAEAGGDVIDPEAVRVDPRTGQLWWTTEGDRRLGLDPGVRISTPDGRAVRSLPTPRMFRVDKDRERGPRHNVAFEGLSFAPDGRSVFVAMEAAIYEDDDLATEGRGSITRITKMSRRGRVLAQYAYYVMPIPAKPAPGKFADNGISEILALDNRRMLVLERSAVEGETGWKNYIRIFESDSAPATDIKGVRNLPKATYTLTEKRLVLDLSKDETIGHTDNIEGMAFGPRLANGRRTLVLVSDNNFNATQVTQFLAFEVIP
jgi:hypothetical protein